MAEQTLQAEHEELQKKYKLVSDLLTAEPNEHVEFKKFESLLNGEFREFADAESSLAEEATAVQRLEKLAERLKELVAFPHLCAKRTIAIGGGFSSGKSAFVNSFVEGYNHLLPERVQPATAIPSFVIASSEMAIKGFSRNGDTVAIDPELYSRLSRDFIDTFSFNLKDLMPSITVEVPLRGSFEHICLIDTPGYNPGGRSEDRATAAEMLKDRDAVIWMIGAAAGTVPLEDLRFLEDLELGELPLYVVLSRADSKPRSELEAILAEVKETLDDAGIEPLGISVYSSRRGGEFFFDQMSLADFFGAQNRPKGANADLKQEIESVFAMYANAIGKDERTAKWMTKELRDIDFHISDLSPDDADVLGEKISKLIDSQKRDFAPIKKQMGEIRQKMLGAVDEIFQSLNLAAPELMELEREANEFFVEMGHAPSPEMVDEAGVTDLHRAGYLNLPALAQSLLDQGADIEAKATLHASISPRYTAALDKAGEGEDVRDLADCTPLYGAALADAREAVEVLLQHKANVNAKDREGDTPLHNAAVVNASETAEVLLQHGAKINAKTEDGRTPLYNAAVVNASETAEVLLQHGAKINAKTEDGRTPLHIAVWVNAPETAKVLLQHNAKVNAKDKDDWTPLHYAAENNSREAAEVLLQQGAKVNAKDESGWTPLHYAAATNARKTAKVLLEWGADVNAEDWNDDTPLAIAESEESHKTADLLIRHGGRL